MFKIRNEKSCTYLPYRIGTFFHLKFPPERYGAKVQKESTKKQPCSPEAQLGSSLRRLLLQNVSHADFVVVPSWPLGREKEDLCLRTGGRTGMMMVMLIMVMMSIRSNDHDYHHMDYRL